MAEQIEGRLIKIESKIESMAEQMRQLIELIKAKAIQEAQVQPPMTEREMVTLFVQTLKYLYYDELIGNSATNFSNIVMSGERIEHEIRTGNIAESFNNPMKRGGPSRRKDDEVQQIGRGRRIPLVDTVAIGPRLSYFANGPDNYLPNRPNDYPLNRPNNYPPNRPNDYPSNRPNNYPFNRPNQSWPPAPTPPVPAPRPREVFTPISMTYTELYPKLIERQFIRPIPTKPFKPPYPRWYDPNITCPYHDGVPGHGLENCMALKRIVQQLIESKWLDFSDEPNVTHNPLPPHQAKPSPSC